MRGWLGVLAAPQWVQATGPTSSLGLSASASDWLMNLLLYMPFGALVYFALPWRWRRYGGVWGLSVACVFAVSWSIESVQSLSPSRVASRNDVLANTLSGGLAALLVPLLWHRNRRLIFRAYCASAPARLRCNARLQTLRANPRTTYLVVLINGLLIGGWYLAQVSGAMHQAPGGELPFQGAFELPYDAALMVLGRSMLFGAVLGTLVLMAQIGRPGRVRFGWLVLAVFGLSVAAEAHRAATTNARPDLTGPILATAAAILMALTLYALALAVRKSNRRTQQRPYSGPDRRQTTFPYGPPQ